MTTELHGRIVCFVDDPQQGERGSFAWAIERLKAGNRVRRASWDPGLFFERLPQPDGGADLPMVFDEEGDYAAVEWRDAFASDWEITK